MSDLDRASALWVLTFSHLCSRHSHAAQRFSLAGSRQGPGLRREGQTGVTSGVFRQLLRTGPELRVAGAACTAGMEYQHGLHVEASQQDGGQEYLSPYQLALDAEHSQSSTVVHSKSSSPPLVPTYINAAHQYSFQHAPMDSQVSSPWPTKRATS